MSDDTQTTKRPRDGLGGALGEVAWRFARLGVFGFGGPAAHIAMMEDEFVKRLGWLDRQRFLDLVGATSLIPGPNSTEMTMHVGAERAGMLGLITAGVCFITPAVLITTALAWAYVEYGTTPIGGALMAGVQPVVIALIGVAVWRLGGKVARSRTTAAFGVLVGLLSLFTTIAEIWLLLGGGVIGALVLRAIAARGRADALGALAPIGLAAPAAGTGAGVVVAWHELGLAFLKIGSVLYGSGYVLFALLEDEMVESRGWLTREQLIDAVAIGQVTPGPVFSTAAFIGYLVLGFRGAAVASVGIFLPAFVFVAVLRPVLGRARRSALGAAFLDAVNAAAVGLMAAVLAILAREALDGVFAFVLCAGALAALLSGRINFAWVVAGGAVLGMLVYSW